MATAEHQLAAWYENVHSRRVDVNYAGSELFLIEGDSLLLLAFSDPKLDFEDGFQLLHAVYLVEICLRKLIARKCNFHIVFFDNHEQFCIPKGTAPENRPKFLLARAVILRHLQKNLAAIQPNILIKTFTAITCQPFVDYLSSESVYFVMCSDGAQQTSKQKSMFRTMINWFVRSGYNAALINSLEFLDTKVMAMVLESPRNQTVELETSVSNGSVVSNGKVHLDTSVFEMLIGLPLGPKLKASLTEREILTLLVLAKLYQEDSSVAKLISLFLLHTTFLQYSSMASRRFGLVDHDEGQDLVQNFAALAYEQVHDGALSDSLDKGSHQCDMMDIVDGRFFYALCKEEEEANGEPLHIGSEQINERYSALISILDSLCGNGSIPSLDLKVVTSEVETNGHNSSSTAVMPFSSPVFDQHLAPIHLSVDSSLSPESDQSNKIFSELTHWHNAKPVQRKGIAPKVGWWILRRNQYFMAEMIAYAASLTNASGKILDPEVIIAAGNTKSSKLAIMPKADQKPVKKEKEVKEAKPAKKSGPVKKGGKAAALEAAAAVKASKVDAQELRIFQAWEGIIRDLNKITNVETRYAKAKKYLQSLSTRDVAAIGAEVELFMMSLLLELWSSGNAQKDERSEGQSSELTNKTYECAALMWDHATHLLRNPIGLTKTVIANINEILGLLDLPALPYPKTLQDRKLPFTIRVLEASKRSSKKTTSKDLSLHQDPRDFQLSHCGPYFDRSIDSAPDARVAFHPDGWQRKVLDGIDQHKSLFVVAPTSAGKTFISFYAMKQVLESSDEDVLVYVAPTKALVNQIAAEVQARFSKSFKHAGRSVWGIHTRDYRINNPTGCQVLVTVPHILQIMLLAPTNAEKKNSWSNRIKRIIFDEVHCIGQADDGLVWEQLLLLAPCPIIALSATVGNPKDLSGWLSSTQKALGHDLVMVKHEHRYSDLRKFLYLPPKEFTFDGLKDRESISAPGLDGTPGFAFVHPIASLVNRSRGIPEDLSLEARDCLLFYQAIAKHQNDKFSVSPNLHPAKALPEVIRKADVLKWEQQLKTVLKDWMKHPDSPFDLVLKELSRSALRSRVGDLSVSSSANGPEQTARRVEPHSLESTTLPLLVELHQKEALPAILFNYDRAACESLAQLVIKELEDNEKAWKANSAAWKKKMEAWEAYKLSQELASKKAPAAKSKKKGKRGDDDDDEDRVSKADLAKEAASSDFSLLASFDPETPLDGYHFADWKKLTTSELADYTKELTRRGVPNWLIKALGRGIGVHHAGMNRKYRQVVEMLFRKGFLRVVIATGTLALGINMPCKTVVFSGDSVFLTALNFRQAAGRAGRRGFDVLGNVVFQGISFDKVCRLLSSRLPDLNGHFPITTSLVLRLCTLLHETKESAYATKAIDALLSQPRLYLGGDEAKMTVLHHLRFSLEYLRRQSLLGPHGSPLNFAGCISHLYYAENSSFAFHALLKEGYFHTLCANITTKPKDTLLTLMLTISHLFGRLQGRQADEEFVQEVVKRSSSIVFLPPMPKEAETILRAHNKETLGIFQTYVETYVEQHVHEEDNRLPLTEIKVGGPESVSTSLSGALAPTKIRSRFTALSGYGDQFESISDLCRTVRTGVYLEESVIPHVALYPEETSIPLNAYLLDFYKHGDVSALEKANRISRGNVWFLLNDFSLVLATIVTSLMNFMKLNPDSEGDMTEVQGGGDASEEAAGIKKEQEPGVADDGEIDSAAWKLDDGEGLMKVLQAFKLLKEEFDLKFKVMWS
ncbi:P-loop containing nucleoside triphosphate hydrolase protein [Tothia fuscella]|uniref:P-loop containing nucleoside triphosphate hydrolase protein n=1 Tax=Tothia fuscella TaxID=1048955 RepID=A0A9P4P475_9PEZI|nr:P-loop containing nucleoside triphosphate hydrolase protein [Tothia fuscella]